MPDRREDGGTESRVGGRATEEFFRESSVERVVLSRSIKYREDAATAADRVVERVLALFDQKNTND